jgi:hypothetical protein
MSAKEKTYTFRAPKDLAMRMRKAFHAWIEDRQFLRAYAEWARVDEEGAAVRASPLDAASDRWRDE